MTPILAHRQYWRVILAPILGAAGNVSRDSTPSTARMLLSRDDRNKRQVNKTNTPSKEVAAAVHAVCNPCDWYMGRAAQLHVRPTRSITALTAVAWLRYEATTIQWLYVQHYVSCSWIYIATAMNRSAAAAHKSAPQCDQNAGAPSWEWPK